MNWNIVLALIRQSSTTFLITNIPQTANAESLLPLYHLQNEKIRALYPRLLVCPWESIFLREWRPSLLDKTWSWTQVPHIWHECSPVMCSGGSLSGFGHGTKAQLSTSSPRSREMWENIFRHLSLPSLNPISFLQLQSLLLFFFQQK